MPAPPGTPAPPSTVGRARTVRKTPAVPATPLTIKRKKRAQPAKTPARIVEEVPETPTRRNAPATVREDTPSTLTATSTPPIRTYHAGQLSTTPIPAPSFGAVTGTVRKAGNPPLATSAPTRVTAIPAPLFKNSTSAILPPRTPGNTSIMSMDTSRVSLMDTSRMSMDTSRVSLKNSTPDMNNKRGRSRQRAGSVSTTGDITITENDATPKAKVPRQTSILPPASQPVISSRAAASIVASKRAPSTPAPAVPSTPRSSSAIPFPRIPATLKKTNATKAPLISSTPINVPPRKRKQSDVADPLPADTSQDSSTLSQGARKQRKLEKATSIANILDSPKAASSVGPSTPSSAKKNAARKKAKVVEEPEFPAEFEDSIAGFSKHNRKKMRRKARESGMFIGNMITIGAISPTKREVAAAVAAGRPIPKPITGPLVEEFPPNTPRRTPAKTTKKGKKSDLVQAVLPTPVNVKAVTPVPVPEIVQARLSSQPPSTPSRSPIRKMAKIPETQMEEPEQAPELSVIREDGEEVTETHFDDKPDDADEEEDWDVDLPVFGSTQVETAIDIKKAVQEGAIEIESDDDDDASSSFVEDVEEEPVEEPTVKEIQDSQAGGVDLDATTESDSAQDKVEDDGSDEKPEADEEEEEEDYWDTDLPVFNSTQASVPVDISQAVAIDTEGVEVEDEIEDSDDEGGIPEKEEDEVEDDVEDSEEEEETVIPAATTTTIADQDDASDASGGEDEEEDDNWDVDLPVFNSTQQDVIAANTTTKEPSGIPETQVPRSTHVTPSSPVPAPSSPGLPAYRSSSVEITGNESNLVDSSVPLSRPPSPGPADNTALVNQSQFDLDGPPETSSTPYGKKNQDNEVVFSLSGKNETSVYDVPEGVENEVSHGAMITPARKLALVKKPLSSAKKMVTEVEHNAVSPAPFSDYPSGAPPTRSQVLEIPDSQPQPTDARKRKASVPSTQASVIPETPTVPTKRIRVQKKGATETPEITLGATLLSDDDSADSDSDLANSPSKRATGPKIRNLPVIPSAANILERSPGKTPSRTPGRTPAKTPAKTATKTPSKTPAKTPSKIAPVTFSALATPTPATPGTGKKTPGTRVAQLSTRKPSRQSVASVGSVTIDPSLMDDTMMDETTMLGNASLAYVNYNPEPHVTDSPTKPLTQVVEFPKYEAPRVGPDGPLVTKVNLHTFNKPVRDKNVVRKTWVAEEIQLLKSSVEKYAAANKLTVEQIGRIIHTPVMRGIVKNDQDILWMRGLWQYLLEAFPDRPFTSIKLKTRAVIPNSVPRFPWTPVEEKKLVALVSMKGRDWWAVAKDMGRDPVNVREHYLDLVKRGDVDEFAWDDLQDRTLVNMVLGFVWHAWVHDNKQSLESMEADPANVESTKDLVPNIDWEQISTLFTSKTTLTREAKNLESRFKALGLVITPIVLRKWAAKQFEPVGHRAFVPRVLLASLQLSDHLAFIRAIMATGASQPKFIPWMSLIFTSSRIRFWPERARMLLYWRYLQRTTPAGRTSVPITCGCLIDFYDAKGRLPSVDDDLFDKNEEEALFFATDGRGVWISEDEWREDLDKEAEEVSMFEQENSIVEMWREAPKTGPEVEREDPRTGVREKKKGSRRSRSGLEGLTALLES